MSWLTYKPNSVPRFAAMIISLRLRLPSTFSDPLFPVSPGLVLHQVGFTTTAISCSREGDYSFTFHLNPTLSLGKNRVSCLCGTFPIPFHARAWETVGVTHYLLPLLKGGVRTFLPIFKMERSSG